MKGTGNLLDSAKDSRDHMNVNKTATNEWIPCLLFLLTGPFEQMADLSTWLG